MENMKILEEEYRLLFEQRNMLFEDIKLMLRSFHTSVFSALAFLGIVVTLVIRDNVLEGQYASIIIFGSIQIILAIVTFIIILLITTNNDRDYIRAIDRYIKEKYSIKTLFYNGELSHLHINNTGSSFFSQTLGAGILIVVLFLSVIIPNRDFLHSLFTQHTLFSTIIIIEVIAIAFMVLKNFIYKFIGKSDFYEDCYDYLISGGDIELIKDKKKRKKTLFAYKKRDIQDEKVSCNESTEKKATTSMDSKIDTALELLQEGLITSDLAEKYGMNPDLIEKLSKELGEKLVGFFKKNTSEIGKMEEINSQTENSDAILETETKSEEKNSRIDNLE